jgi:hypothetical protein
VTVRISSLRSGACFRTTLTKRRGRVSEAAVITDRRVGSAWVRFAGEQEDRPVHPDLLVEVEAS